MKKRIISAIIILLIFVPCLLVGGLLYDLLILLIGVLGLKELLDAKEKKKRIPAFIKFICFTLLILLLSTGIINESSLSINYTVLLAFFITLLIPTVLYHDREKYSVNDAFYLIGCVLFL